MMALERSERLRLLEVAASVTSNEWELVELAQKMEHYVIHGTPLASGAKALSGSAGDIPNQH